VRIVKHVQRPRHDLPAPAIWALRPVMRFSNSRDAYVLRGIGHRVGPVVRRRTRVRH
jgi:hypothetical protein